ncbi:MAG: type VI secretion system baseplate subunit TssF [Planctomycetota bacterium]
MNEELLKYYEAELKHLRELGEEFKRAYPKVASRLGIEREKCTDPYVERLLEGFAFLAARVRLKLDSGYSCFIQHLLDTVYPHFLRPLPSMAVVQFTPSTKEGNLDRGVPLPRGTKIFSDVGGGKCCFRTSHDVNLTPLRIATARYRRGDGYAQTHQDVRLGAACAEVELKLQTHGAKGFEKVSFDRVTLFLPPDGEEAMQLYECLTTAHVGTVVTIEHNGETEHHVLQSDAIRPVGFDQSQALLPYRAESFSGYRLLQEYFAMPSRFMFVEIVGLKDIVNRCDGPDIEVKILFERAYDELEREVSTKNFALHCTPAINLFDKIAKPIPVTPLPEHQVLADTRPVEFEIYSVDRVSASRAKSKQEQEFFPLYSATRRQATPPSSAFYATRREPKLPAVETESRLVDYLGDEVFLSLVDSTNAPYASDLETIFVETTCTSRHLPEWMIETGRTDFYVMDGQPVASVEALVGPTPPSPSRAGAGLEWAALNQLTPNFLALSDLDGEQAAGALRELLMLYDQPGFDEARKQIEGIRAVITREIVERIPCDGPVSFDRGVEVCITVEKAAFAGSGHFLFGEVLANFFSTLACPRAFMDPWQEIQ